MTVTVRRGGPEDLEPALEVWRAAEEARRGVPASPEHGGRVRAHIQNPTAFLFVADDADGIVGMAVGMQGLADDGAGPPVEGLCHIGAVFVRPTRWDEGLGGALVDAVLAEARSRGYARAQLWTHAANSRAHRLYERRDFRRTGREGRDDHGETIAHYARRL
ncbi:MAG: GNAT family N-acetyltransferase [Actinomycetota bacterium]|nr:GNAT family N-acetyltransferase [Actinomycetota bacterium]